MNFRDGFYGGRVEVFTLRMDKEAGQTIAYKDYCSLYPWVNKYSAYPKGEGKIVHPSQISVPITCAADLKIKGFLRCKVSLLQNTFI